jgi:hypothetical protein
MVYYKPIMFGFIKPLFNPLMVIDPLILGDKPNEIFGFRNGMDDHGTFGFV